MRTLFADTSYWVALINPRDDLHQVARDVSASLGPHRIVTSDMIMVELLNGFADHRLRMVAAGMVNLMSSSAGTEIVPQTRVQFRAALALYLKRSDKEWSLTDCASFVIMDEMQITEALTHDRHFEQNGYTALLR